MGVDFDLDRPALLGGPLDLPKPAAQLDLADPGDALLSGDGLRALLRNHRVRALLGPAMSAVILLRENGRGEQHKRSERENGAHVELPYSGGNSQPVTDAFATSV